MDMKVVSTGLPAHPGCFEAAPAPENTAPLSPAGSFAWMRAQREQERAATIENRKRLAEEQRRNQPTPAPKTKPLYPVLESGGAERDRLGLATGDASPVHDLDGDLATIKTLGQGGATIARLLRAQAKEIGELKMAIAKLTMKRGETSAATKKRPAKRAPHHRGSR